MLSDEEELIQKILKKNEKAFYKLYRLYNKSVFQFILRQVKNESVAEEITQDVFIDFIEELRDFRKECSIKTFLFSIARYKTIDFFHKKKIKKILFSAIPEHIINKFTAVFMDDELERKELTTKIALILKKLPNDYRVVLRLKYMDGERLKVIAKKMELSFKATESLLFRARKAFMKAFSTV